MDDKPQEQAKLRPYHDINSPFTIGEGGNYAEYIARDIARFPDLIFGAFVLVWDKHPEKGEVIWHVGLVTELRAISPFNPQKENALYAEDEKFDPAAVLEHVTGPHTHQPTVAKIRLERQMVKEGNGFASLPVQRPPSASSCAVFPDLERTGDAPALRDMLDIKSSGIDLGYVGQGNQPFSKGGSMLPYKWDVDNLDNKHMFIVGESGSGKTVFLKNLAYQLRKNDPLLRIIMTDVQGDIGQLLTGVDDDLFLKPRGWQVNVKKRETVQEAMKHFEKCRLIVPATKSEIESPRVAALKALAEKNGHEVMKVGLRFQDLRAPSDVEYLFRTTSIQVGLLLDKIAEYCKFPLKRGVKPRPASIHHLRYIIEQKKREAQEGRGVMIGGTAFLETTMDAALRALTSLENYFDFDQTVLGQENNPLDSFDHPEGVVILYLDELDYDERIMWEMQLVKWLYEKKKEDWGAFVFFDEAHQIIPAKPTGIGDKGTFERLRVNFERLAREGRKFGINLVLSTQNPQDLHAIVPEQCPTKIVMKINPRNAAAATLDKDLADVASRFKQGQFWIQSPFNGTSDWIRVHSDAPPLPHMAMTPYWKKIEAAALKEQS